MRAVVQRVSEAWVHVEGREVARIGRGLLVLVGFVPDDGDEDFHWVAKKVVELCLFEGEGGRRELSVKQVGGELLVVSQFTLLASIKKGTKPSWHRAAPPAQARQLYEEFLRVLRRRYTAEKVKEGVFGAYMGVGLVNDGPVTIIIDSRHRE